MKMIIKKGKIKQGSLEFLAHRIRIEDLILPMLSYSGRQVKSSCEIAF